MNSLLLSHEGYSLILCTAGLRAFSLREGAHVVSYQQLSVTYWLTDNQMCIATRNRIFSFYVL